MKTAFALMLVLALPARAQEEPRLYDVIGVSADDVLNLRSAPSPTAPVVGVLSADATGIEVTARTATRRWGRVNTGDGVGWASLRFLQARERPLDAHNLPVGLRCFGTEPFWSLDNSPEGLRYTDLNGSDRVYSVQVAPGTGAPDDLRRMVQMTGPDGAALAYIYPNQCSDGMSERRYALSIGLSIANDAALRAGCCTLTTTD